MVWDDLTAALVYQLWVDSVAKWFGNRIFAGCVVDYWRIIILQFFPWIFIEVIEVKIGTHFFCSYMHDFRSVI